jgi:hypothetical protein
VRQCNMPLWGPRGFFFFFEGRGGRGGGIFVFFSFPSSSQCIFQLVPNNITLLSHTLCPKLSSFHLHRWAKRGNTLFSYKNFYFEECWFSIFFFFLVTPATQSGSLQNENFKLGRHPPSNYHSIFSGSAVVKLLLKILNF